MSDRFTGAYWIIPLSVSAALACGCSSSSSPSSDPRQEVASMARDDLACTTDADCCVVFDGCLNDAYVVAAKDKDKAASLLASADQSTCTGCIPPATQVSCGSTGFCTGVKVECAGSLFNDGMKNHCGSLALPAGCTLKPASLMTPVPTGKTILHCG